MVKRHKTVFNGIDSDVIPMLLELHCSVENPKILDCTYNKGVMWKGLDYDLTTMDIDPEFKTDIVGDFRNMDSVSDNSFDVIVFDPPHLPSDIGATSHFNNHYNTDTFDDGRKKDNISLMFQPFLDEAKRVLVKHGIILTKLADLIHNGKYQWQQVDFINAVSSSGMTPCDMMIKCDPKAGNLTSSKWKNVFHLRKNHCYWIVVRNSGSCCRKINRSD